MFAEILRSTRRAAAPLALVLLALPAPLAGELEPPGPPGPTMKTLDQVEPRIPLGETTTPGDASHVYIISEPGSYYLTGDLVAVDSGVKIDASHVTLDLAGFEITDGSGRGIVEGNFLENVTIRNGTISGFGSTGVFMGNTYHVVIEGLRVTDNGTGIAAGRRSRIAHSMARGNAGDGFALALGGIVESSVASANGGLGMDLGADSLVHHCVVRANQEGGVRVGEDSVVVAVTAGSNTEFGIRVSTGGRVLDSSASGNTGHGIDVTGGSFVSGNECRANHHLDGRSGSGIHVQGSDSRIDGNNVTDNDRGIHVADPGNVIVRNSAASNAMDYLIASGNDAGPIDPAATATSPWANLYY